MIDQAAAFSELTETALIRASGADARAFLHAQLTSDVAGLPVPRTQYAGYCSAKGRLLATFLVWSLDEGLLLQLPRSLAEDVRARLAKYVMRSKVTLEITSDYACFGLHGADAHAAWAGVPHGLHAVTSNARVLATRLTGERFVILAPAPDARAIRESLASRAHEEPRRAWEKLDIEQGIPVITPVTQEQYVPQMVNLDLIGAVSYSKGCYPGQEIVARTHYLGRLKQRMYAVRAPAALQAGDPIYSAAFGAEQASGTIVNTVSEGDGGSTALAVIQTAAVASADLHWKTIDGPALELLPPPYPIPE